MLSFLQLQDILTIYHSWMYKNRLCGLEWIIISGFPFHLPWYIYVIREELGYIWTGLTYLECYSIQQNLNSKATCNKSCCPYPPIARILLILGCCVREGGHVFVHKGTKAQPEVAGELAHLLGQLGTQVTDGVQIIFHGKREVHQVVEIHWVVLHLPHLQPKPCLVSWMGRWKQNCWLVYSQTRGRVTEGSFVLFIFGFVMHVHLTLNV